MVEKVDGRYMPMYDEIVGTLKVFAIVWLISIVILFLALGLSKWAFWGAVGIGFIVSIVITFLLSILTGTSSISLPFGNRDKK